MMAALRRLKAEMERLDVFLTSEGVASEENISATRPGCRFKHVNDGSVVRLERLWVCGQAIAHH